MISFQTILSEALGTPYMWRWTGVTPTAEYVKDPNNVHRRAFVARFHTQKDMSYLVRLGRNVPSKGNDEDLIIYEPRTPSNFIHNNWSIGFNLDDETLERLRAERNDPELQDDAILKTGDPFRIYATVSDVVKNFLEQVQPDSIEFEAFEDEPSRVSFYTHLIRRVNDENIFPNHKGISLGRRMMDGKPAKAFAIVPKSATIVGGKVLRTPQRSSGLTESVNKPFAWQWDPKSTEDDRIADFKTDIGPEKSEQIYHVTISRSFENDKIADAGYHAADDREDDAVSQKWFLTFSLIDRNGVHQGGVEHTGQAGRVFATLGAILKDFIIKERPESVGFSGIGKSREKLYVRLMRTLTALNLPYAGRVVSPTEFEIYPREIPPAGPTGLTESGDAPYTDIKWIGGGTSSQSHGKTAWFMTDTGAEYQVIFTRDPYDPYDDYGNSVDDDDYDDDDGNANNEWDIEFKVDGESLYDLQIAAHAQGKKVPGPYDVTGMGDAFRVMATVTRIVKQFVTANDPEEMTFNAKEKSRIKLYDRFLKNIQQALPNYTATSMVSANGTKYYTLTKRAFRRTPPASPPATPADTHATYADTPTTKPPITEALKDAYPWTWNVQLPAVANSVNGELSGGRYEAQFQGEYGYDIVIKCTRLSFMTNKSHGTAVEWEFIFAPDFISWSKMLDKHYIKRQADMDAGRVPSNRRIGQYRATGAGDEFRVMATIVNIMLDFMKREKPDVIMYTANMDEPSRAKLYKRLTEKVHTMAPDYFGKVYPFVNGEHVFRLIRRDAPPLKIGMVSNY